VNPVHTGAAFPVTDLVAYFAGRWALDREIADLGGARIAEFTGTATFTPDETTLVYQERGTLSMDGHRGPATRTLCYRLRGPGQADAHFDHGGFFHALDLRSGRWSTRHPCRDDLYQGEFVVRGPDAWRQDWTVTGPAKSYTLATTFRRATAGSP
jgi:uncharacterized protein DUF6314